LLIPKRDGHTQKWVQAIHADSAFTCQPCPAQQTLPLSQTAPRHQAWSGLCLSDPSVSFCWAAASAHLYNNGI